jgi:hypothetical protein
MFNSARTRAALSNPAPAVVPAYVARTGLTDVPARGSGQAGDGQADMGNYVLIALVFVASTASSVILQVPDGRGFHIYCIAPLAARRVCRS